MDQGLSEQRVVEVATRLFAGLGYDMTSLELIADALGVPAAEVREVAGSKRELYMLVMERVFEAKRVKVQEIVDTVEDGREAAYRIAEAYLDFYVERPQLLALWTHRWVSDAAEITDVEDRYLRPLMRLAAHRIDEVVPDDLGPYGFLGVVLWCINGFLGTGLLAPGRGMMRVDDPEAVKYFRAILHTVIERMLVPPPSRAA
ncbi:TetR/AcrR family transcriptional regulator [Actinocorallia populi]|uniref:TetR/AcrR family transcriptional regulator n=1 Tax=Actinocorallia populi TaxID=2079200 RepID=UPI000D091159|nr:TetR/AcrR family transcriptional regulator [Actinocorallia populi]